jgi:hypothetical protein
MKLKLTVAIDYETLQVSRTHPYTVTGKLYIKLVDCDIVITGHCSFGFDSHGSATTFKNLLTKAIKEQA